MSQNFLQFVFLFSSLRDFLMMADARGFLAQSSILEAVIESFFCLFV